MHPEWFEVPLTAFSDIVAALSEGKKVVGVGTTVIRTLESLPYVWRTLRKESPKAFFSRFEPDVSDFWDRAAADLPEGYSPVEIADVSDSSVAGTTKLFLMPGSKFRVVSEIVTNFHLPESTLLVLVSAFAGIEKARAAYAHALSHGYRFYSFGDGMWVR